MDTVRGGAAVALHPHRRGTAGEYALNAEAGPGSDTVAELFEKLIPAVIGGDARPVATFHQSYRFPIGKLYEPAIKEPSKEQKEYFVYKLLNYRY